MTRQEPLNFLRQAEQVLRSQWIPWAADNHPQDAAACLALLGVARRAPKFLMPPGGRLLNDRLRGLPRELRLPFRELVIEYEMPPETTGMAEGIFGKDKCTPCTKRIVVAMQHRDDVMVYSMVHGSVDGDASWTMMPFFAGVSRGSAEPATIKGMPIGEAISDLVVSLGATGTLAPSLAGETWRDHAYVDLIDEIHTVLELIEALSCSNVSHEALPVRKLNKSAAKRGAMPFDEYRVLVVGRAGSPQGTRESQGHRSPREHLRRGHIRELANGKRLWIQQTVVNAGVGGKVTTVRDLRRAA